jgi:hypothetical protein
MVDDCWRQARLDEAECARACKQQQREGASRRSGEGALQSQSSCRGRFVCRNVGLEGEVWGAHFSEHSQQLRCGIFFFCGQDRKEEEEDWSGSDARALGR